MVTDTSQEKKTKKFYCMGNAVCSFKQSWVNDRCFATYPVRSSCRYIKRKDGKSWALGSKEREEWQE